MVLTEVSPRYLIGETGNYTVVIEGGATGHKYCHILDIDLPSDDVWILGWGETIEQARAHGQSFLQRALDALPQLAAQD